MSDMSGCTSAFNPLDIQLILDLVLQHVEPKYLLNCRLVNHSWNESATHQLNQQGWTIHLRGGAKAQEYLQLIEATEACRREEDLEREDVELHLDRMELAMHIDSGPRTRGGANQATNAAIEIICMSLPSQRPPFTSLECTLGRSGIESNLARLIAMNAATLRGITVHFCESEWDGLEAGAERRLNNNGHQVLPLGLELPALKSICVEYASLSMHSTPSVTRAVLMAAPNLERIRVGGFAMSPVLVLALTDIGADDPRRLNNLLELELHLAQIDYMLFLRTTRFNRLRILRVNCVGLGVLLRITQFVHENCPALEELEISDQSPQTLREADHAPIPVPAGDGGQDGNGIRELPNLTHFGFNLRTSPESPWVSSRALADAEAILRTMHGFQNLNSVAMNFEGCIAAAKLFTSLGGNCKSEMLRFLPAVFRQSKWALVTELTIDVPHASIYEVPDSTLRQAIAFLLGEMFPALERLVINLGSDRVTWKTGTDLGYVLGLAFGVKPVKHVKINNYYNEWTLEEPLGAPAPVSQNALESVTVRAIGRSFCKPPPEIDLNRLLALLPVLISTSRPGGQGLELRLDAELLLNSDSYPSGQSYEELLEEIRRRSHPRIKLL